MIDMLGLVSDREINPEKIEQTKKALELNCNLVLDKNYCRSYMFSQKGNHLFWLKTGPRVAAIKETAILINPSRFSGHKEVLEISESFLGNKISINRIDLCSDLPLSIGEIQSRLRVKYKRKRSEFEEGNTLTGFYFGTRNEVIVVYDKARQLAKFNKFKLAPVKGEPLGKITRVEIRLRGNKLPFKSLTDLHQYQGFNPFKNIEIVDFVECDNTRAQSRAKADYLKQLSKEVGFSHAFRVFNQENNFHKTMGKYLTKSELTKKLFNNHINDLTEYLRS